MRFPYVAINPVSLKTISELKVRHAAASVGYEVFGSGMSFGFCVLAGRQGEGRKRRIAEQLSELRNKKKGPARRISCKPLICLVPEAGIEPARPYERGILSPRINPYISVVCEFLRSAVSQL